MSTDPVPSWAELTSAAWDALDAFMQDFTGLRKWLAKELGEELVPWEEHESYEFTLERARELFTAFVSAHKGADPFLNVSDSDFPAVLWLAAENDARANDDAFEHVRTIHKSAAAEAVKIMWAGSTSSFEEALVRWDSLVVFRSEDQNQIALDRLREEALSDAGWPNLEEMFDAELRGKWDLAENLRQRAIDARRVNSS